MGQAKQLQKLVAAGSQVKFDFNAPVLHLSKADRKTLTDKSPVDDEAKPDPSKVKRRAVRWVIIRAVAGNNQTGEPGYFGHSMERRDRDAWAAWTEILDDEAEPATEMIPYSLVVWLRKIFVDERLRMPPGLANWTAGVTDYLEGLEPMAPKPPRNLQDGGKFPDGGRVDVRV